MGIFSRKAKASSDEVERNESVAADETKGSARNPLEEELNAISSRKNRNGMKIVSATGCELDEALSLMDLAKEKYGIKNIDFVKNQLFMLPEDSWKSSLEEIREKAIIAKIEKEDGTSAEVIKEQMEVIREKYGLGANDFYQKKLWLKNESQIDRELSATIVNRATRERRFRYLEKASGKTKLEMQNEMTAIGNIKGYSITFSEYYKFGFAYLNTEEQYERLKDLKKLDELRIEIEKDLDFDAVAAAEEKYEEGKEILSRILSEETIRKIIKDRLDIYFPDEDMEGKRNYAIEIESVGILLNYPILDFLDLHFERKSFAERVEYYSALERREAYNILNPRRNRYILDDKFMSYTYLEKYYDRKCIIIEKEEDYGIFVEYLGKYGSCIKKPFAGQRGSGIEILKNENEEGLKETFDRILRVDGKVILEELVVPHEKMTEIYPDAINTVRISTVVSEGAVSYLLPFMRVGSGGSFLDNFSQGGFLIPVNPDTGELEPYGVDHYGAQIYVHPDTGFEFRGTVIPDWNSVREITAEMARKVAEERDMYIIGWDMTYTAEGKWVVIEANSDAGLAGVQAAYDIGKKKLARSLVNAALEYASKIRNGQ